MRLHVAIVARESLSSKVRVEFRVDGASVSNDWLAGDTSSTGAHDGWAPRSPTQDDGDGRTLIEVPKSGFPASLIIAGECLCVAVGAAVLTVGHVAPLLAGYLVCGIVLPLLWSSFFLRQRRLSVTGHPNDHELLVTANRYLLVVGIGVAFFCAWSFATALAK